MPRRAVLGGLRTWAPAVVTTGALALGACSSGGIPHRAPGRDDWPTYGHDPEHTFHGASTLTPALVPTMRVAWRFPTGDAVTATPTVVNGVVYAGSWDGWFYAVDLRTGRLRWKYHLRAQPAVTPQPGVTPRDVTSDGGLVTSSAWYQTGVGSRPDLVIFGGGYTLYALDAETGQLYWAHAYTGRPDLPPDPAQDGTRIFSSPIVTDGRVLFGVSVDGQDRERGYIAAADLSTGAPVWEMQTDMATGGGVPNDGCGSVWSSGTLLPAQGAVVFDTADCHFSNPPPYSEAIVALRVGDGSVLWVDQPPRPDPLCDLDFGATPNAGLGPDGKATFLGVGGKDGTYYSLDPVTGAVRWSTNVVFGGFSGGFIATAAYDGSRVYGSTALGDFGRFEHGTTVLCDPSNPRDLASQEPSAHAFDATTGAVAWQGSGVRSVAPTTVAAGMTFNGIALSPAVVVREASTGRIVSRLPLPALCWSGIATVGDALVLGTGASQQGSPDGIVALTPGGAPPRT
jgi:polyvinyl alcohol dehydrogenase (cytochrome)